MEYLTVKETGENWDVTTRMVNYYYFARCIKGTVKKGSLRLLLVHASKRIDERRKVLDEGEKK